MLADGTCFYLAIDQEKSKTEKINASKLNFSRLITESAYVDQYMSKTTTAQVAVGGGSKYSFVSFRGDLSVQMTAFVNQMD